MAEFDPDAFIASQESLKDQSQSTTPNSSSFDPDAFIASKDSSSFDPDAFIQEKQGEKYGSTSQQVIAGLEGAGEGAIGPFAPMIERGLGISAEDIAGRREAYPATHAAAEAATFAGSMLTGVGEAAMLGKAGEVALKATQLANLGKDASLATKLARGAVRMSTEMGLFEAGDEATKAIENGAESPGDVVSQMKMSNILESAALGGLTGPAFEGTSSLLKRTVNLPFLQKFTDRVALVKGSSGALDELGFPVEVNKPKGLEEKLADAWCQRYTPEHVSNVLGEAAGATAEGGTSLGGLGGLYVGKKILGPVFKSVLKPLMESYPDIDLKAFRAAAGFAQKILEGDAMLNKGVRAVISGGETIPSSFMPTQDDLEALDEHAKELNTNLDNQTIPGNEIGSYMPTHATTLSKTVNSAINYVNQARPQPTSTGMMNEPIPPSKTDMARYYQKLQVVQQPLSVLPKIKDGTLLPTDVAILKTVYPEYYSKISRQLMQEIVSAQQEGKTVPYKTKQALSLFMGQDLVKSVSPQSIIAAQPAPRMPAAQSAETGKAKKKQSISKAPGMYRTPNQASEVDHQSRSE